MVGIWIYLKSLLGFFLISLLLSAILKPIVKRIQLIEIMGVRAPRFVAVLFSFLMGCFTIYAFISLFVPLVTQQIETIQSIKSTDLSQQYEGFLTGIEHYMISHGLTDKPKGFLMTEMHIYQMEFLKSIDFSTIVENLFSLTGNLLMGGIAIIFITFFLLNNPNMIRSLLLSNIPNSYFELVISTFTKVERLLSRYLLGVLIQIGIIFTILFVGMSIAGFENAATIALLAALANLIPYFGPIIGAIFSLVMVLTVNPQISSLDQLYPVILKLIAVFGTAQLVDNVLLQPLIFSKSVKAHPLEIFVVIFAGGNIAGIGGMILAVPVYTFFKVIIIHFYKGYSEYNVFTKRIVNKWD